MPKMGDNVSPTQERKRGNGNKPQQKYLPLPKMWLMGVNEGKKQEQERILQWIADHDSGRCCFESHDLVAFIKGENA